MRSFLAIDPLPSHILILRQNGNQQQEKKNSFCLFLSLSLCIFVSFLPSKLFRLLYYRVFICFCFVRKAHQEPKWIWKHLHRCPPEGHVLLLLLLLLSEFQRPENSFATQTMTIWMENGTWSYYALGSHFQGAADIPWWCWTRVANWGVHDQMICKVKINSCGVLLL